ncbi:MAG: formylmethanofuran dehydrogenase subunit E family protein [Armatimonadota bacterium]
MQIPQELERAKLFHGHLGPWLVLGIRIGEDAVKMLEARRWFGLSIVVNCPPQPPHSCIADGLQISTGCTLGKRNITIQPSDEVEVRVTNTDTGAKRTYRVPKATADEAARRMRDDGEESASLWAWMTDGLFQTVPNP